MVGALEQRAVTELRAAGAGKIAGYAAVFERPSKDLGGFRESIRPGAFTRSLASDDAGNILALYEHDRQKPIGRVGSGTLKLSEDKRGLAFEIELPDTTTGRDLDVLVKRGDVSGASFAFTTPKGGDQWTEESGMYHRTLLDVNLHEITVTSAPAYADTTVAMRALSGQNCMDRNAITLALLEIGA